MIDTEMFKRSAEFNEVKDSLAFLARLRPIFKELALPIGICRCVPTVPTIAKKLSLSSEIVSQEMDRLLKLRWARKYKQENKAVFVVGNKDGLLMRQVIEKRFGLAKRKKDGSVRLTEWRWLALDQWRGSTLWQMITDKLQVKGQMVAPVKAKGLAQMQRLITEVGVTTVKDVGDFFANNYPALKICFKWYGLPNPGLFRGFFHSIKDIKERGFPSQGIDRSKVGGCVDSMVALAWNELTE